MFESRLIGLLLFGVFAGVIYLPIYRSIYPFVQLASYQEYVCEIVGIFWELVTALLLSESPNGIDRQGLTRPSIRLPSIHLAIWPSSHLAVYPSIPSIYISVYMHHTHTHTCGGVLSLFECAL